jgi:hypothetical protein
MFEPRLLFGNAVFQEISCETFFLYFELSQPDVAVGWLAPLLLVWAWRPAAVLYLFFN